MTERQSDVCPKCKKPYLKKQVRISFSGKSEKYIHVQGSVGAKPTRACHILVWDSK